MCVVCCSLFVRCLLFCVCWLLSVERVCWPLYVVRCSLLVGRWSLFAVRCLMCVLLGLCWLLIVGCVYVGCCSLFVVRCLLLVCCGQSVVAYCLLFVCTFVCWLVCGRLVVSVHRLFVVCRLVFCCLLIVAC